MPSSASRRRAMLWRKGVRHCCRCGKTLIGPNESTLEHVVPKSAGGRTTRLKRKRQAIVRLSDGTIRKAELHWYEAHGIGRREMKIKRYLRI